MEEGGWSDLQIDKVIKTTGRIGRRPGIGWKCFVKLRCYNETLVDSVQTDYLKDGTTEITIGNGNWPIDRAIESCLETMCINEESEFHIKLDCSLQLKIEISLYDWSERNYIFQWRDVDKLEASKLFKADGVNLFRSDRIEHAFYKFSRALKMILLIDSNSGGLELHTEKSDILMSLYNNLANCQFQFGNYLYVIELCNKSLKIKPNVKGYFWRAMGFIELKEYEKAENDIVELLKIEPKNKVAIDKYKLIRSLDKTNRDNYKSIVRNMFR